MENIWDIMENYYFVVIVCFLAEMISCSNFTIIYDEYFQSPLMRTFQEKNESRIDLLEINEQLNNLQNITTSLKNIRKDDVVFLLTKNDMLFEYILKDQHLVLKYGISIDNMVSLFLVIESNKTF